MILAEETIDFHRVELDIFVALSGLSLLVIELASLEDYIADVGLITDDHMAQPLPLAITSAHVKDRDVIAVGDEVIV